MDKFSGIIIRGIAYELVKGSCADCEFRKESGDCLKMWAICELYPGLVFRYNPKITEILRRI